jgi:hypothetical protein
MDRTASAGIAGRAESTVPEGTRSEPPSGQNVRLAGRNRGNPRRGPHLLGEIAPRNSHCTPTHLASLVEAGPVPTLADGAILAIETPGSLRL